jgi:hypothetical protein
VVVAGGLLYLAALDALVLAVLAAAYLGRLRSAAQAGYAARDNLDQMVSEVTSGAVATVVGLVLLALVLALFATFDLLGSRIARIGTWSAGGLGVFCCGGSGLVDRYSDDPVVRLAYPLWYRSLHGWLVLVFVAALLLAIVLLLLPPTYPYFRPRPVPAPAGAADGSGEQAGGAAVPQVVAGGDWPA